MAPTDRLPLPPSPSPGVRLPGERPLPPAEVPAPRQLDLRVVFFLSVLAFLLASFPARNSDLWGHLAAGRLVVTAFRLDPGWLYDLLCYGLYALVGGPGLVFVKALLVVGLALVLLRLSRTGPGWWLPAACTALALLAMGTRFLLQPATVSYLLLALTLWALQARSPEDKETGPVFSRRHWLPPWPLLALFVVWVNVDHWFVLGLVVVGLVWLGRALDLASQGNQRGFAFVVPLALLAAVCLLNPAHVGAFALPPELGTTGAAGGWRAYFATFWRSPAGWAYLPLLGLGLLSFVLNRARWRWERFLPWVALVVLIAFQARTVPFFVVVAGPVLAWNLQEYFESLAGEHPSAVGPLPAPLQGLAVALGLALLVAAWPGWLQTPPFEPRHWAIDTAASLERAATIMRKWHQERKPGHDAPGLHLSPETTSAFAWFCPEENGLRDDDLALLFRGDPDAPRDWPKRMRDLGINHVILYDSDPGRLAAMLEPLLADPQQWPLLDLEGNLAVVGWRAPTGDGADDPFRGWQLDLDQLAFHPAEDRKAPGQEPEPERHWWEVFWKPAPPPLPLDRDEAQIYLAHAEALRRSAPIRHLSVWEASQAAGLVGTAGGWAGPSGFLDAHGRLALFRPLLPQPGSGVERPPALDRLALGLQEQFTLQRDDTSPALLYLAVRAARRALAGNPADAQAQLILGESYLRLLHSTRERAWGVRLPELVQLRQTQACTALNRAVDLQPDLAQAHLRLYELYRELGYRDLALHHLETYLKRTQEAGPPPGVTAERFRAQAAPFQTELSRLAKEVEDAENSYEVASDKKGVRDRALLASQKGLAGKARDALLDSDVTAFGSQGMELELRLQLRTGRANRVQEWTGPEQQAVLGSTAYHWLRAQALAASGDYARAEAECAQLGRSLTPGEPGKEPVRPRAMMALLLGQELLDGHLAEGSVPSLLARTFARLEYGDRITTLARSLREEANATVLRGLLALEQGDTDEAEVAFRVALALWHDEAAAASGGGMEFNGRVIAQGCLEWLK
jgi:tetratricopeptide (TPR) repeat protein